MMLGALFFYFMSASLSEMCRGLVNLYLTAGYTGLWAGISIHSEFETF